jgi:ketosteroid isomerase-like protein
MKDEELRVDSLRLVREYIDAINSWDLARMRALLAEDAVMEMPYAPEGFERRIEGRERILPFVELVSRLIPAENLHDLELDTLHSNPGEVVCTYKSDMRINSNPYRNEYIARWTVRDGKISYFGEYFDPIRLVVALGGSVEAGSLRIA